MEIPDINNRIRQLVDYYANGKVIRFSDLIGVKQQTINRLFNLDTRTGKYPVATTEILVAITEMLVDISADWLLIGRGEMLKPKTGKQNIVAEVMCKSDPRDAEIIAANKEIVETQKELISTLKQRINDLERNSPTMRDDAFPSAHSVASTGGTYQSKKTK